MERTKGFGKCSQLLVKKKRLCIYSFDNAICSMINPFVLIADIIILINNIYIFE